MTLQECFHTLGLTPAAGPDAVKKAFRRLARRHHPDLRREQGASADFVRIVTAYTTIQREFRLHGAEGSGRLCPSCGRIAELFDGLDGDVECADCMLGVNRRRLLLPVTSVRVVRHGPIILLEAAAIAALFHALANDSPPALAWSVGLSAAALAWLAVVCAKVRRVR